MNKTAKKIKEKPQQGTSRTIAKRVINSASSSKLTESVIIPNTPYRANRYEDSWFHTIGQYRMPTLYKTFEEASKAADVITWDGIFLLIDVMTDKKINQSKTQA